MKFFTVLVVLWVAVGAEDSIDSFFPFGCDHHYYQLMEAYAKLPHSDFLDRNLTDDSVDVKFHLYTRRNPESNSSQPLETGNITLLENSYFNAANPTRIIVHGFCNCHTSDFCVETRNSYLYRSNYNIITINWPSGEYKVEYPFILKRIIPASQKLAKFIDFLHRQGGLNLHDVYLIGHSLGAHLSGLAGRAIASGKVNTIVGLDPASYGFSIKRSCDRLTDTDAHYVEVIHTNTGWLHLGLGMFDPIGHTDFYPNGGETQPGCLVNTDLSCSHSRAWQYFAESVTSDKGFWSTRCNTLKEVSSKGCRNRVAAKVEMGGEPIVHQKGIFTVQTEEEAPFAKGKCEESFEKNWPKLGGKKERNNQRDIFIKLVLKHS